jgi:hypothetical protein
MLVAKTLAALAALAAVAAPSIRVDRDVVSPGAQVRVAGNADGCPAGDTVTVSSRAFSGDGFAGLGGATAPVRRGGSFSAVARVRENAPNGRYLITARCGGGNLGVAAALYVTRAPLEAVRVRGSGVSGTISFQGVGKGTAVWVQLRGLPPRRTVQVLLQAGTCARHGASFALAASGRSSAAGAFASHGRILFHDEPVAASLVADGEHVFVVTYAKGRGVCAPIAGIG